MDPKQKPDEELNPAKNTGQVNFDKKIDKNFGSDGKGTDGNDSLEDIAKRERDAAESGLGEDSQTREDVEDRENDQDSLWRTNVDQEVAKDSKLSSIMAHKKRVLIISGVLIPTFMLIGAIFSLLSGALGIVNLKETAMAKLTQRADNVMTRRMNRVMVKKFSQDFTTGCTIKVKCRYRGMSTREVKKFNKRNMGNGVRLTFEKTYIPGRVRLTGIEHYSLPADEKIGLEKDGSVKGKTIKRYPAREFKTALKNDPVIAKSVLTFYKPYVQYHSGLVGRAMLKRVGVNLGKKTASDEEDSRSRKRSLISSVQNSGQQDMNEAAKKSYDELPDEAKQAVDGRSSDIEAILKDSSKDSSPPSPASSDFDELYSESAKKIEESTGGGLLGPIKTYLNPARIFLPYCTLRAIVRTANQVRKVNQTIQLIKFSALFYTIADQIKAGDATPKTTEAMNVAMSILMTKDKHGLSGFDSLGFNWINSGAVRSGTTEDVTRFQNGGSAGGILGKSVSVTTSGFGPICAVANSTAATVGLAALEIGGWAFSIMTAGAGAPLWAGFKTGSMAAVRIAGKKIVKEFVEDGVGKTVKKKLALSIGEEAGERSTKSLLWKTIGKKVRNMGAITAFFLFGTGPFIEALARSGTNAVTQDLVGPDSGNALYAGDGAMNSKGSQAQGLEPITAEEAVEQDKNASKSSMARAKIEGIDQFDVGNPYSFANRFAYALVPSMSKFGSIDTMGTGFSQLFSSTIVGLSSTARAETDSLAQYQFCQDEEYLKADVPIAGDPFCNPQFGFDPDIVNGTGYEPEKVVDYAYDNGYVDENGEPKGEFSDFIEKCLESNTTVGQNEEGEVESDCVSREDKFRALRMYCIDTSIDTDMKEEVEGNCATQDQLPVSGGDSSAPIGSGGWSIQDGVDDNITDDLREFLDKVAQNTSYEPIVTTTTGGEHAAGSDHYSGNAADFGSVANEFGTNNAQPGTSVPRGDELAAAALIAAGIDPEEAKQKAKAGLSPGTDDVEVTLGDRRLRVQTIWKSAGHYDHVHIGVKRL